jgi:hypothetical protein
MALVLQLPKKEQLPGCKSRGVPAWGEIVKVVVVLVMFGAALAAIWMMASRNWLVLRGSL